MSGILSGPPPSFTKRLTGYRTVGILVGDTLPRIAARELNDAAQWYDLAALNKLKPPYIVDDPSDVVPGVLLSGQDTLQVPSVAPPATGVAQAPSVFGSDCYLAAGQLTPDDKGDFAVVAEERNLVQAIEMRLRTRPGDLLYHPEYGCRAYSLLGKGGTPAVDQLAAAFVASAINSDPRISRAAGTKAQTVGDVLACSSTAIAVNGKRLPVSIGKGS